MALTRTLAAGLIGLVTVGASATDAAADDDLRRHLRQFIEGVLDNPHFPTNGGGVIVRDERPDVDAPPVYTYEPSHRGHDGRYVRRHDGPCTDRCGCDRSHPSRRHRSPHHSTCTHRKYIPAHYETRTQQVCVASVRYEIKLVPAVYEYRYTIFGRKHPVLVRPACHERVYIPPRYETRTVQVHVPGKWVEYHESHCRLAHYRTNGPLISHAGR